jgi:hypothetical protein
MYLVYESLYGDLLNECDSTNIIGLYDTKEKAIKKAKELINNELSSDSYVLDEERNNIEEDNYVRFFFNKQENWSCFYEILIEKVEVE